MPVAYPTLLTRQLTCRGAHEQRRVVGGIVNPYDIQPPGGALLVVQQMPPPEPDEASLPRDVPLHVRCHLGHGAPGMDHLAVDRTPPALARRGWRSPPQLDVDSEAPQQGVLRGRRGKLLLGGNAGIHDEEPFSRGGGQRIEDTRHRVLAAGAKTGAAHQSYTHPLKHDDRGHGGHDIGPPGPACPMTLYFARQVPAHVRPSSW